MGALQQQQGSYERTWCEDGGEKYRSNNRTVNRHAAQLEVIIESSCFDGIRYGTRNLMKIYCKFDSV